MLPLDARVQGRCWRVWSDSVVLFPRSGLWVVESGGGCCIGSSGGVSVCLVQFKLSCEVAFVNSLDGGREGVSQG